MKRIEYPYIAKRAALEWQKLGLQQTRSGYGSKLTTTTTIQLPGEKRGNNQCAARRRRVSCSVLSSVDRSSVPAGPRSVVSGASRKAQSA